MELSENFITKLFDTLNKSIDNYKITLDKSVEAQIDSINYMKPKVDKIEENSNIALDMLTKLFGKINIMIVAVCVATALVGIAYFVARFLVETPPV
jgi:hypothetical protein